MSEPARIFPFDAHAGATPSTAKAVPGVTISTRRPGSMLNVRGELDDAVLAHAMFERYNVILPREPNTATGTAAVRALWLGPDEWLLVSQSPFPETQAGIGTGTITDVSHGRAALRVSGPDARAALASGCPLDLHPREFAPDRCAQTAIAKVSVILDHVQPDVFDLYCSRSYAGAFWHWLTEACAEYRYAVVSCPSP